MGTIAAVSEVDKVVETSRLWHMRLGHAGEKSLQSWISYSLVMFIISLIFFCWVFDMGYLLLFRFWSFVGM